MTQGDGYAIEADGHVVDVAEFERVVGMVHRANSPGEQVRLCDEALARWRGKLLADLFDDRLRRRVVKAVFHHPSVPRTARYASSSRRGDQGLQARAVPKDHPTWYGRIIELSSWSRMWQCQT